MSVFCIFDEAKLMCCADLRGAIHRTCAIFLQSFLKCHFGVVNFTAQIITERHISRRDFTGNIIRNSLIVIRKMAKTFGCHDISHIAHKLVAFLFAHFSRSLCDIDNSQNNGCCKTDKSHFYLPLIASIKTKKGKLARGRCDG